MNINDLEYRMYGLVPYNLSDIQKGIQFGHAVVEYFLDNPMDSDVTDKLGKWSSKDKTFIILNGGTTNDTIYQDLPKGTLNQHELKLLANVPEMPISRFCEPDLGGQLTAICFLVDERVWNQQKYPDFEYCDLINDSYESQEFRWKQQFSSDEKEANKIIWLRYFLNQFKLA